MLVAAEKAHLFASEQAMFLLMSAQGMPKLQHGADGPPIPVTIDYKGFARCLYSLSLRAAFAEQFNARLRREQTLSAARKTSRLHRSIVRVLWSHCVSADVKFPRGVRGPGKRKRSAQGEKDRPLLQK